MYIFSKKQNQNLRQLFGIQQIQLCSGYRQEISHQKYFESVRPEGSRLVLGEDFRCYYEQIFIENLNGKNLKGKGRRKNGARQFQNQSKERNTISGLEKNLTLAEESTSTVQKPECLRNNTIIGFPSQLRPSTAHQKATLRRKHNQHSQLSIDNQFLPGSPKDHIIQGLLS